MKCKICKAETLLFDQETVLGKYRVRYYRCSSCGFVQTEDPYWLNEAYSETINKTDVGLVNRNFKYSIITKSIILAFFDRSGSFIDYGGGYGLFVRLMRDYGFDFHWHDHFCPNLFAAGLESTLSHDAKHELLTAFEVFEHLANPLDEISNMLDLSKSIFFSTALLPSDIPKPCNWWYYGLEHGQHVSFFTHRSLLCIAKQFGLNMYTDGRSLHLLTDKTISPFLFTILSHQKIAALLHLLYKQKTLLDDDFKKAVDLCKADRK